MSREDLGPQQPLIPFGDLQREGLHILVEVHYGLVGALLQPVLVE